MVGNEVEGGVNCTILLCLLMFSRISKATFRTHVRYLDTYVPRQVADVQMSQWWPCAARGACRDCRAERRVAVSRRTVCATFKLHHIS